MGSDEALGRLKIRLKQHKKPITLTPAKSRHSRPRLYTVFEQAKAPTRQNSFCLVGAYFHVSLCFAIPIYTGSMPLSRICFSFPLAAPYGMNFIASPTAWQKTPNGWTYTVNVPRRIYGAYAIPLALTLPSASLPGANTRTRTDSYFHLAAPIWWRA